jgi:hypothetical protein
MLLDKFPNTELIREEEIQSLSKTDIFAKLFACVQSIWLVVQSIARYSVGLPITELELATMALTFCALIMYILWWDKPFGVEHKVTIYTTYDSNITATIEALKRCSINKDRPSIQPGKRKILEKYFQWRLKAKAPTSFDSLPNLSTDQMTEMLADLLDLEDTSLVKTQLSGIFNYIFGNSRWVEVDRGVATSLTFHITATIFSAFHLGAWNWDFPTPTIQIIWRSFALATTSAGSFIIISILVVIYTEDVVKSKFRARIIERIAMAGGFSCLIIYTFARLGLIILIFYCFSSMPIAVYESLNWLEYLPHFG